MLATFFLSTMDEKQPKTKKNKIWILLTVTVGRVWTLTRAAVGVEEAGGCAGWFLWTYLFIYSCSAFPAQWSSSPGTTLQLASLFCGRDISGWRECLHASCMMLVWLDGFQLDSVALQTWICCSWLPLIQLDQTSAVKLWMKDSLWRRRRCHLSVNFIFTFVYLDIVFSFCFCWGGFLCCQQPVNGQVFI